VLLDVRVVEAAGVKYNKRKMVIMVQRIYADRVCIAVQDGLPSLPTALAGLVTSFVAASSGMHHLPSASERAKEQAMTPINTPPCKRFKHFDPPEPSEPAPPTSVPSLNPHHSSFGKEFKLRNKNARALMKQLAHNARTLMKQLVSLLEPRL
jgi:hypothetical protein